MDGSVTALLKQESRQSNAESPGRGAERLTRWLWLVAAVVAIAGLLFGYDQGVISGALRGIENTFHRRYHCDRDHHELGDARRASQARSSAGGHRRQDGPASHIACSPADCSSWSAHRSRRSHLMRSVPRDRASRLSAQLSAWPRWLRPCTPRRWRRRACGAASSRPTNWASRSASFSRTSLTRSFRSSDCGA